MTGHAPAALDGLLVEPKRLQICGSLAAIDDMEFGTLRDLLGVADSVLSKHCLLYTSDAADERSSVDLGGRRIIKKKNKQDKYARASIIR